jgi:ectoine hydroxylase-related dioxygenase (phytanoyl-CoA dioxygenase family)
MRFTPDHVAQWREQGFVIINNFFTEEEYKAVLADFDEMYAAVAQPADKAAARKLSPDDDAALNGAMQFKNIDTLPYQGSSAINLISLHPALIDFARALLGTPDVHCYQSHTWAKFTGQADYTQAFHCDFGNHTLTVPSDDPTHRTVDFIFYLTDVSRETGALRYVTKPDVESALGKPALAAPDEEQQKALRAVERVAEMPAGSLLAHGIDTMHRGANMTQKNARRFSMTVGFKAAGNDAIGFHVWQSAANRPWHLVFNHATPEQLLCLGIPKPGDTFWSERTLKLTQSRWPEWDMTEYFAASGIERGG